MIKKILKIILTIIVIIVTLFIIAGLLINYFAGMTGTIRNGETYCKNKEYSIGKMLGGDDYNFFCDNKNKGRCISKIKSYILGTNKDLYIYFESPNFVGKTESEINEIVKVDNPKGYIYSIFSNDYENKYYAKNYNEVISFLKLNYSDCKLNFYKNGDIDKLNNEEKNIFLNLSK